MSFFDVLHSFHRMRTSLMVLDEVLDTGIDNEGIRCLHELLKEKVADNTELGIYVVSHKNSTSMFAEQEGVGKVVFQRSQGFTTLKE